MGWQLSTHIMNSPTFESLIEARVSPQKIYELYIAYRRFIIKSSKIKYVISDGDYFSMLYSLFLNHDSYACLVMCAVPEMHYPPPLSNSAPDVIKKLYNNELRFSYLYNIGSRTHWYARHPSATVKILNPDTYQLAPINNEQKNIKFPFAPNDVLQLLPGINVQLIMPSTNMPCVTYWDVITLFENQINVPVNNPVVGKYIQSHFEPSIAESLLNLMYMNNLRIRDLMPDDGQVHDFQRRNNVWYFDM